MYTMKYMTNKHHTKNFGLHLQKQKNLKKYNGNGVGVRQQLRTGYFVLYNRDRVVYLRSISLCDAQRVIQSVDEMLTHSDCSGHNLKSNIKAYANKIVHQLSPVAAFRRNLPKMMKLDNSGGEGMSGSLTEGSFRKLFDVLLQIGCCPVECRFIDIGAGLGNALLWFVCLTYQLKGEFPRGGVVGVELNLRRFQFLEHWWEQHATIMRQLTNWWAKMPLPTFNDGNAATVPVEQLVGPEGRNDLVVFAFDNGFTAKDRSVIFSRLCEHSRDAQLTMVIICWSSQHFMKAEVSNGDCRRFYVLLAFNYVVPLFVSCRRCVIFHQGLPVTWLKSVRCTMYISGQNASMNFFSVDPHTTEEKVQLEAPPPSTTKQELRRRLLKKLGKEQSSTTIA